MYDFKSQSKDFYAIQRDPVSKVFKVVEIKIPNSRKVQQMVDFNLDQGKINHECADIIRVSQYLIVVGCYRSGLISIFKRSQGENPEMKLLTEQ